MTGIPYNYGKYIDDTVRLKDQGVVDAGKQVQSPASAGSRGLTKTTQFTKDKTQMKMGNSPIAESMVEIRNILNRIDGVNVPVQEGHYPHSKSFDKLYGINDMQQYKAMADDAQTMDMREFMDTYSSVIDMAGDFWEDHQKTSESNEGAVNEDPNTLAKELASEIMKYVRKGFDHIPADALKAKAKEYLSSIKESAVQELDLKDLKPKASDVITYGKGGSLKYIQIEYEILGTLENMLINNSEQEVLKRIADFVTDEVGEEHVDKAMEIIQKAKDNDDGEMTFDDMINQLKSQKESAVQEDDNSDYIKQAYMLAVKHHTDGSGDGNINEDIGDLIEDYNEKADKKISPEQIMRISKTYNAGGDYVEVLSAEGIDGKLWLEVAKKKYSQLESSDSGELSRLKELSGLEENAKVNFSPEQIKQLMMWNKKYSVYSGKNGDELPSGLVKANTDSGITSDGYEENEVKQYEKMFGKEEFDWDDSQHGEFQEKSKITGGMMSDLEKIVGVENADDEYTLAEIGEKILGMSFGDTYEEQYQPFPEGDEFDIEEDEDFEEVLGPLGFPEDETELFDAEYQGRKVPLNKPMRGDVKKFKVYVKDPKSGNVKKVNFGHGGTSAKRKTMRIRKSNPKARKSFRARHNCANPGPKTKARYWSCRKW